MISRFLILRGMKKFLTALLLAAGSTSFAQQSIQQGGCGTVTSQQELQEVYDFVQHNPAAYAKGTATVDTIPLSVHIVGDDAGNGYYPISDLLKVICQLNERYAPVNFYFYVKGPIEYINNSDYYIHNYSSGGQMMDDHNVDGTVNVYFVDDPAGACGYYTFGEDAVAIKKSCSGNNSTTLTHELGHFFSLPHTFSGWENGNTPSNPEAIRRTGPGANCNSAGDGFCDTDADYLSVRWNCPFVTAKTDQFGETYRLDSSVYMSYSSDACQSRFSAQQIAKMQNNLQTSFRRTGIRNDVTPPHSPLGIAPVIYPAGTMYNNLKKIVWNKMPGATYYYVRIVYTTLPNLYRQTAFTSDTSLNITFSLVDNAQYTVTIYPVNGFDMCQTKMQTSIFTYTTANGQVGVNLVNNAERGMQLYPNPISSAKELGLRLAGIPADRYDVQITNMAGAVVYRTSISTSGGIETKHIELPELTNGLYFVRCSNDQLQMTQKLVINR